MHMGVQKVSEPCSTPHLLRSVLYLVHEVGNVI